MLLSVFVKDEYVRSGALGNQHIITMVMYSTVGVLSKHPTIYCTTVKITITTSVVEIPEILLLISYIPSQ